MVNFTSSPILVTGGAGFIGSHFVREWVKKEKSPVITLDSLTYAGNLENLSELKENDLHRFVRGSIMDVPTVVDILETERPWALLNFAAQTHVDRSIANAEDFVETNIVGTYRLLEAVRAYLSKATSDKRDRFRFLQISTDEVYGSLSAEEKAASEIAPYAPRNPYAATKAASDLITKAWGHTYDLPILTVNGSNTYGPCQFSEKLIPLVISNCLSELELPIYGDGKQIRDWLYVEDFCAALRSVLFHGQCHESYNIGGECQKTNLEIVFHICALLDKEYPRRNGTPYADLIKYVLDRPGHDRRYALDIAKIRSELGWKPKISLQEGLSRTVGWFLEKERRKN